MTFVWAGIAATLCLAVAGMIGGCRATGGSSSQVAVPVAETAVANLQASADRGKTIFEMSCAGCHSGGGNRMNPVKPVKGSDTLKSTAGFIAFIRNPGGGMPAFDEGAISDADAEQLRQYLVKTFK